jgi:hypothetical protein
MQIEKHTKRNVIVEAIREGLTAIGRAKATQGQQIFLVPTGWQPGDELVPVEVVKVIEDPAGNVAVGKDEQGEPWGLWL